jgi:hypothetical protein
VVTRKDEVSLSSIVGRAIALLALSSLLQAVSPIEITPSKKPKRTLECLSEFRMGWRTCDDQQ